MKASDRRPLGRTGISTTLLGLGGAPLADLYETVPEPRATATIAEALDRKIRLFDTAPLYGRGLSEHRIGHALRLVPELREEIVLSTKVGRYLEPERRPSGERGLPFRLIVDYTYDGTMRALEQSYQRLGMNRIDIVHIHDVDVRNWGESLFRVYFRQACDGAFRALAELRSAGVIGAISVGVNEVAPLLEFAHAADFDAFMLAGRYTLLEQEPLDELFPLCESRGIGVMVAAPFNSGVLLGRTADNRRFDYKPAPPEVLAKVKRMEAIADRHGVTLAAAALQFPAAHPAVAGVVVGAARPEEIAQNVGAMSTAIPADFWSELKTAGLMRPHAPTPRGFSS